MQQETKTAIPYNRFTNDLVNLNTLAMLKARLPESVWAGRSNLWRWNEDVADWKPHTFNSLFSINSERTQVTVVFRTQGTFVDKKTLNLYIKG